MKLKCFFIGCKWVTIFSQPCQVHAEESHLYQKCERCDSYRITSNC